MCNTIQRRQFAKGLSLSALATAGGRLRTTEASPNQELVRSADTGRPDFRVELPRGRVPLSFIIDDSTCLVNMGKFCMPQFSATYPNRTDYQKPWRDWPDEIPDAFVRKFGQWCQQFGVKGKYSIVPYPACVGWLDRVLPGWSQQQLGQSLDLVRELMMPNWDIHPEMITHTRVIDLKTGRPYADFSPAKMENSYPQEDVSVDYLASYLAYALRILKNCGLPCEGVTTPGGFGNRVKEKLPLAVAQSVHDVFAPEIKHYFKYIVDADESAEPKIEFCDVSGDNSVRGHGAEERDFVVNVLAGTGDWFGGWDGVSTSRGDLYCNADASAGRMVDLIRRKQPAVMLCHWPGMYCNGEETGFRQFQQVVQALHRRYGEQTLWMKVSEMARYWATKHFVRISVDAGECSVQSRFACPDFTFSVQQSQVLSGDPRSAEWRFHQGSSQAPLKPVSSKEALTPGMVWQGRDQGADSVDASETEDRVWFCVDLPAGASTVVME
ncbi:MAG: hypothetical protein AAGG44_12745 [Planctomycetota bacterium]